MMTPQRKAEIETLLAQITPGEWYVMNPETDPFAPDICVRNGKTCGFDLQVIASLRNNVPHFCGAPAELKANAAFIAAAPGIVRELLAEVERLQTAARMNCPLCGVMMDEGNFGYHCRECGHTIELD